MANYDVHVPPEREQEPKQAVRGESLQAAAHQSRHFGLIHSKRDGGSLLRPPLPVDDARNLAGQCRFRKGFFRVTDAQVREGVAAAPLDGA